MTYEEFYGKDYERLKQAESRIVQVIVDYQKSQEQDSGFQAVQYCKSRIKSPESMAAKLRIRGLPVSVESALTQVNDAVGARAVCAFSDDIYKLSEWIQAQPDFKVIQIKDYIAYPKDNGYLSYHMILKILHGGGEGLAVEVQIRTIAQDFWASLEHQLKYKKEIRNENLIRQELKRCADEIASADLSMQVIKDLIGSVF